jgi:hypothetical protein
MMIREILLLQRKARHRYDLKKCQKNHRRPESEELMQGPSKFG